MARLEIIGSVSLPDAASAPSRVEIYRRPESGRYQESMVLGAEDTLECHSVPGVSLPLAGLFA